jgi:hypothetical protein
VARRVKYEINLINVFERAFSDKSQAVRSKLRPLLNDPNIKARIAEEVIDKIVSRTRSGVDKKDSPLAAYSESYKKSLAYKVAGKRGNVNMTLTGEMLAAMVDNSPSGRRLVRINFADKEQNDKAAGHIDGSGPLPVRDFFGLPEEVEEQIVRKVVSQASKERILGTIDAEVKVRVGRQENTLET